MTLQVAPTGGKWWRIKYRFGGREKRLSLGVYPAVSLKEARSRTAAIKDMLRRGIDPGEERKAEKAEAAAVALHCQGAWGGCGMTAAVNTKKQAGKSRKSPRHDQGLTAREKAALERICRWFSSERESAQVNGVVNSVAPKKVRGKGLKHERTKEEARTAQAGHCPGLFIFGAQGAHVGRGGGCRRGCGPQPQKSVPAPSMRAGKRKAAHDERPVLAGWRWSVLLAPARGIIPGEPNQKDKSNSYGFNHYLPPWQG